MKRRLLSLVLALLLLGNLTVMADDELPMSSAAAYYLDETLYAFAQFPDYQDAEELNVGLMVNNVQVGEAQPAHRLTERDAPAQYMMLVDCSTSMPEYIDRIQALGDALMTGNVSVTVATFGVAFHVAAEKVTDAQTLRDILANLDYTEEGTDICGGAAYAVDYMRDHVWEPGSLSSILLITDGIPFYSHDGAVEARSEAQAAAALKEVLSKSPQVLMNSVCFEAWEPVTREAVSSGIGYHLNASDAGQAASAGQTVTDFYGSLYGLEYPLEQFTETLSLRISNTEIVTIKLLRDLTEPEDDSVLDGIPIVIDVESDPGAEGETPETPSETPEQPASPAPSKEPGPKTAAPEEPEAPEVPEAPSETPESAAEPPDSTAVTASIDEPEPPVPETKGVSGILLGILIGAGVLVLILAGVLIALLTRRKKNGPAPAVQEPSRKAGIPLRVDVLQGGVANPNQPLFLSDSLLIGSDQRCDLVLTGAGAAPVHCRIFLQNGGIYIEDLNSASGTALSGMRIYAPNPLPSGTEVMIGENCILVWYGTGG